MLDFKASRMYFSTAFNHGETTVENTWEKSRLNLNLPGIDELRCDATYYIDMLERNIARAGKIVIPDQFFLTYVSYSPPGDKCRDEVMRKFNEMLDDQKLRTESPFGTGIVIMDFPTTEIIQKIIDYNYQGKLSNLII